ncbi:protein of unknown function [Mucilaginibacter pineti]|uniref:DUF1896 domain-containing protein n=1 Tax=Mucilaginibacter pineti TaxID=1391627 RepID=A0A1G7L749_9SPHI|nr:DUF1896 family protein [Mucilaginibacter pineti]SDF45154.1 protein of unknown function [Mucilaginibacter pineti]
MKELLINKLYSYLLDNHLDLLIALQEDHRLTHYLETKVGSVKELYEGLQAESRPAYVIEALCLEELTRDLRPSRFEYMRSLLEQEFESEYQHMADSGILTYEVISLIGACEPVFEVFSFSEDNEDDKELKYALIGMIAEYLER